MKARFQTSCGYGAVRGWYTARPYSCQNTQLWFSRIESLSRDLFFKVLVLVFWLFLVIKLVLVNEDEHLQVAVDIKLCFKLFTNFCCVLIECWPVISWSVDHYFRGCTSLFYVSNGFYRAMHFSAKRGIAIACRLSVCLSVTLVNCDHIG